MEQRSRTCCRNPPGLPTDLPCPVLLPSARPCRLVRPLQAHPAAAGGAVCGAGASSDDREVQLQPGAFERGVRTPECRGNPRSVVWPQSCHLFLSAPPPPPPTTTTTHTGQQGARQGPWHQGGADLPPVPQRRKGGRHDRWVWVGGVALCCSVAPPGEGEGSRAQDVGVWWGQEVDVPWHCLPACLLLLLPAQVPRLTSCAR
jgi:hypothetical protein